MITIPRCYDSHVHWSATGEVLSYLDLSQIKSISDLKKLNPVPENHRGEWLFGFGWDENKWQDPATININNLDDVYPDIPVVFIRADGHAIWINTKALKHTSSLSSFELQNTSGNSSQINAAHFRGILIENDKYEFEKNLPKPSNSAMESYLLKSQEVFRNNGFTHIRDMDGSAQVWECARKLEATETLKLFVDMNFSLTNFPNLKSCLSCVRSLKKEPSRLIRISGIKFYFDGTLGSDSALLSHPYPNGKNGLQLFSLEEAEEMIRRIWEAGLPVAIHTIGDEAVHKIVKLVYELKCRGTDGVLNLEHCEVVRPETIRLMRTLDLRCHLQASHFLTDKSWIKDKLGDLYQHAFPWKSLDEFGINYSFGSDSPIAKPDVHLTRQGIAEAANAGIPAPLRSIWASHSHPDGSWGTNCLTRVYQSGRIEVEFNPD